MRLNEADVRREFREQFGDVGPDMADAMFGRLQHHDERRAMDYMIDAACNSVAARELFEKRCGGG